MTDFARPGLYRTKTNNKAEVVVVRGKHLIGIIMHDRNVIVPAMWNLNGKPSGANTNKADALVGEWVD